MDQLVLECEARGFPAALIVCHMSRNSRPIDGDSEGGKTGPQIPLLPVRVP